MPFNGYAIPIQTQSWVPGPGFKGPVVSAYSGHVPEGYVLQPSGYDVEWSGDGTVGRGRPAFDYLYDAEVYARNWNDQRVRSYLGANRSPPTLPLGALISDEVRAEVQAWHGVGAG